MSMHRMSSAAVLAAAVALSACGGPGTTGATSSSAPSANPATTAGGSPPAPSSAAATRTVKWVDLKTGDCVSEVPQVELGAATATVVDCSTPHVAQVFLRADVEVNDAIADVANSRCAAGFAQYTGRPVQGSPFVVTYLIDSTQDRTSNNPLPSTVICLAQAAHGEQLTEPLTTR